MTVDSIVARFFIPEGGAAARPHFVTQRELAFLARLTALTEDASQDTYQDRHLRAALDELVAVVLLAHLPLETEPDAAAVARIGDALREGLYTHIGGQQALERAAKAEGISEAEIQKLIDGQTRAAFYIDRQDRTVLRLSEEQLRQIFRTTSHPFRTQRYEEASEPFSKWLFAERFHTYLLSYLQATRGRISIVLNSAKG